MENFEQSACLAPSDTARSLNVLLEDAGQLFSAVAACGIGLWSFDLSTGHWTLSDEMRTMLGLAPDGEADASIPGEMLLKTGDPEVVFRVSRADTGEEAWLASSSHAVLDGEGQTIRIIGVLRDVTTLRRNEIEHDINESQLEAALTVGRMVIWDLDIATGIVTRSANADDLLGVRREPIVDFFASIHPDDRPKADWETSANPTPPQGDVRFRYRHPAGRDMWLETSAAKLALHGERGHVIGITSDITERQKAEERLRYAANHDPLTGLLNRKAWTALLEAMTTAKPSVPHHLVIFDVDLFKAINDGFGHAAGDAVLFAIGERLRASQLPTAAARLGGDEFAALVPGGGDDQEAARAINACLRGISEPVAVCGRDVKISISAGVARFPEDGTTAGDLAKNADLALYAAKTGGRKRAFLFSPTLRADFDARLSVLSDFRDGLRSGHVAPFYQPKVALVL